ncbi:MAG TPA: hypothetical protein DHV28_01270 [Ignavibacteriales bacterium]|nr:hypothetical protein [Ignavibacteriales bacterium]
MKQNLIHISGVITKSLRFLFFAALLQISIFSQPVSNLDKFYNLVDSASTKFVNDIGAAKKVKLELTLGSDYSLFANQIRGKILKRGIDLMNEDQSSNDFISASFVIDNTLVSYSVPERDGFFGSFYTERILQLSGNYFISSNSIIKSFNLVDKDTINIEDVEKVENRSYPFTRGELPPEPFFSSLLEPIVAIGAAAVTIILFFSVRSK